MSNKQYDFAKWMALVVVPAIATLVGVLGPLWGLPNSANIVSTITAVDAFLGTILGVSSANHRAGTASDSPEVTPHEDPQTPLYPASSLDYPPYLQ